MPSQSPAVRTVRTYVITPRPNPEAKQQVHLSVWDTVMLGVGPIQKGLLFKSPHNVSREDIIKRLKDALKEVLFHFYPLGGRMRSVVCDGGGVACHVEVGGEGDGAEFVHAVVDAVGVADVVGMEGQDLPGLLKELFPLNSAINVDSRIPLLSVQATELTDGIFIGCTFNHAIGDGTSFWMFFNAWAEIARCKAQGKELTISQPPVHDKWFIGRYEEPPIKLPYSSPNEFVVRFTPPPLRDRMFHFSGESLSKLKARANQECPKGTISTFQALSALMWRAITRARRFPPEQKTICRLAIDNRARLQPQLSPNYFGNSIYIMSATVTARELLENNLGWAAWLVNQVVANHTDLAIRGMAHKYMGSPVVSNLHMFDMYSIMLGSSPRFDMYGCDFGWGKAVAVRSGSANKFDGKVTAYPGREGGGSVDLEVSLLPEYRSALERDEEFLEVVSPPVDLG